MTYTYDLLDRAIEEVYYNSSVSKTRSVTFVYDARGQLAKRYIKNASDTVTETHIFEYASLGRLIRSSEFDGANNLIQRIEQLQDRGRFSVLVKNVRFIQIIYD